MSNKTPSNSVVAGGSRTALIDASADRFPFCIVWSPLPVITWVLPFIGHLGIADSEGIIHDFEGTNCIGRGNFLFGAPTRYLQLNVAPNQVTRWDEAVAKGSATYGHRTYNFFLDNCHSYVAECLTGFPFSGRRTWNMVVLCFWMFFQGKYVDTRGFVKTWLPFALVAFVVTKYYVL
ncbi:hypothetical protein PR003_g27080 [Phytophthora rubi]|uniref:LRAT domain-containing protein n=2 Tax=Phytophthora TaxID=4783 RepID=A0A6A3HPX2_9STRA|nr:hypothetical protein PF011_g25596 [Phytophthora fragariae]KAE8995334.1 hypothetical protein PR001_g20155 [Phytophthora rubi]KAE9041293.1 hypothetical protein PR002_g4514 [Phytophthora rubi]KAE9283617.1 hypothetical protein PR003_g27080 [Phytophthora rubi]KAE9288487.1 hypothetical protein PF008_g26129 [Phytophthora fragariae]